MAHYAQLDSDNVVVNVFVGRDENDSAEGVTDWEAYYAPAGFTVKQTSYNTSGAVHYTDGVPSADQSKAFRFNYAGIGYTYDSGRDAFISPKPYESWVLDEASCLWDAPVEYPTDGSEYRWDEDSLLWVEVEAPIIP
tara:strand:+ start:392 stop:802 length:411 start_codon:yes stop_codon:yes gene_type:complete